ncbi:MAG: adenosylhomocysteine nucleosidase [Salibacteraceae bacterium]|jgi:adenosylhomocysteine nucleosidase
MKKVNVIGIMGAMPEEIDGLIHLLTDISSQEFGKRVYYSGFANGVKYVIVFSRWGKVAAATTITTLIHEFGVSEILFIGVAGAIHPALHIGDVVLAKRLIQHDLNGAPLVPRFEIPLLGQSYLTMDDRTLDKAEVAITDFLKPENLDMYLSKEELIRFNMVSPQLWIGDIASGDQFISKESARQEITENLPGVLCVEMEGAAVAQVCYEYGIALTVIRTISDVANGDSEIDFPAFIQRVSRKYSVGIVQQLFGI